MKIDKMKYSLVIAVDFGTTYSGFAYQWVDEEYGDVKTYLDWPNAPFLYSKMVTEILYNATGKYMACGWSARKTLVQKRFDGETKDLFLLNRFKMRLYEGSQQNTSKGPYFDINEKRFFVVEVIADYLRELKAEALDAIQKQVVGTLEEKRIYWCLTVPAIWKDENKKFMREAAQKAGMIGTSEEENDRLLIVLEPEAGAQYCMVNGKVDLKSGNTVMIADLGGGTADIVVHEVVTSANKTTRLKELLPGEGNDSGSTKVDDKFMKGLLPEYIPREAVEKLEKEDPVSYMELREKWMRFKHGFESESQTREFFDFTPSLYKILVRDYSSCLKALEKKYGKDTGFYITGAAGAELFNSVIESILDEIIEPMLRKLPSQRCNYVFMIGGLSTSKYVQKLFKERLKPKGIQVIIPASPSSSVLQGAVLTAIDSSIVSRKSRLTYGFACAQPFEPNKDPISKKFWSERFSKDYCTNRFAIVVSRGDSVEEEESREWAISPLYRKTTTANFSIHSSTNENPRFTDENSVTKLGELVMERTGSDQFSDKGWKVKFYFGKSEPTAKVEVHDLATGQIKSTRIRFSSTHSSELT